MNIRDELHGLIEPYVPDKRFDLRKNDYPEKFGDYSVHFIFLKKGEDSRSRDELSKEFIDKMAKDEQSIGVFEKIEFHPSGYINFFLSPQYLQHKLGVISKNDKYGESKEGSGKKVIVEYSSPNIAKPMHIGHLRSTIIGDAIANVYEKNNYEVIRWNYIGDWGTQFGKVLAGYKKWGNGKEDMSLSDMLNYYVRSSKELTDDEGKAEFKKLEEGDEENKRLWEIMRRTSLNSLNDIYRALEVVGFKEIRGESDYESKLKSLIEELEAKGLAKESEGALIIDLGDIPPMMLRKSDGATLYATRDIASLEDRITNYHPDKILYVVANQQALHFEQLFAVAKKLGWTGTELVHVKFGMVLGEDGKKLATREGKVVPLQEVIDKTTALARETVRQKNSNLPAEEMERVAHVVAIGALKYNDLRQHPYSDIEFDWKAMLDLSGNSGPYIQYTYARLANIWKKVSDDGEGDVSLLTEYSEHMLMRQLLDYPEAIKESAERYALNGLALYLYDLAHRANQFYEQVHVVEDENISRRDARLMLIRTVARTLKDGLALLGIETLDRI